MNAYGVRNPWAQMLNQLEQLQLNLAETLEALQELRKESDESWAAWEQNEALDRLICSCIDLEDTLTN